MSETKPTHNPWAGLASYDDPLTAKYELQFCGRDDESYDVAKLIRNNIIVTLYGKSGIGKTSLINAGVIPNLRDDCFMPLSIRLGLSNDDNFTSYQSIVIQAIESTSNNAGITIETFDVIPEQTNVDAPDYLWNYFARHHFTEKGSSITPVIVFDQFEEVLRTHRDKAEVLLRQLHYLSDKDHRIDNCEIEEEEYHYEFNFRFVISIREDDLYRLEDSIDNCYLASLKRCRYRLRSLSEEGAKDVVQIPGEGLFLENEEEQIAKSIINIARNKEDGGINTYILSLVCYRIFLEYSNRGYEHIGLSLVEEFVKGNPFEQYYDEATKHLLNREKEYLEEHFVDSTGRRNSIPESDFHKHVPNGNSLLEGDKRILQRISSSSNSNIYRVELLHDSFCDHLFERKQKRQQWQKLRRIGEFIGILIIICLIWFLFDNNNNLKKEKESLITQIDDIKNEYDKVNNELLIASQERNKVVLERDSAQIQLDSLNIEILDAKQKLKIEQKQSQENKQKFLEEKEEKEHLKEILTNKNQNDLILPSKSVPIISPSSFPNYKIIGATNSSQNILELSEEEIKVQIEKSEQKTKEKQNNNP